MKNKVVLVPFPFDDFSQLKVRPALCLSNLMGKHNHLVIAFISSKVPEEVLDTDIILKKGTPLFAGTGLLQESVIRVHKLVTIPKSLIQRELGMISQELEKAVLQRIDKIFRS